MKLAEVGGRLLVETIRRLHAGTLTPQPQDNSKATLAPLLKKEDGLIAWTVSATDIANRIRGLSPWPGAYAYAGGERWILSRASAEDAASSTAGDALPGTVVEVRKDALIIATGQGLLALKEFQPANSRRMTVPQYLAGHTIAPDLVLGPGPEAGQATDAG